MTALLALVPRWVWAAMVAALAATSCKLTVDLGAVKLELEKTKVVYEQERANALAVLAHAQERARAAEDRIEDTTVAIREETYAQVTAATALADALRRRLRDAQARTVATRIVPSPTTVAAAPEAPGVVDEPLVPATLGEQDVDEAQRADTIRVELLGCYRQYDAARSALEGMRP